MKIRFAKDNKFKSGQLVKTTADIESPGSVIKKGTICTATPCSLFFRSSCYDIENINDNTNWLLFVPEDELEAV